MKNNFKEFVTLSGHKQYVTSVSIADNNPNIFLSASRDNSILVWVLNDEQKKSPIAKKRLKGHSHFVSDVHLSTDGNFCISSSWDKSIRLWDVVTGKCLKKFNGHEKEVYSISFSEDNRQIISGSKDYTIKLWNTVGMCKKTFCEKNATSWISKVLFLPTKNNLFLSCDWDGVIKIWDILSNQVKNRLFGHKGYIQSITISPDGSLCASGGKDSVIMLWDLQEAKHLYSLDSKETVVCLTFSPNRYWLCCSTLKSIKIWDLETKALIEELSIQNFSKKSFKTNGIYCSSMSFNLDGNFLITGYSDGNIKIWSLLN